MVLVYKALTTGAWAKENWRGKRGKRLSHNKFQRIPVGHLVIYACVYYDKTMQEHVVMFIYNKTLCYTSVDVFNKNFKKVSLRVNEIK